MSERRIHVGSALAEDLALEADVVVVGTGAGGGISAEVLAGAGLRVVMVEEGAYRTPEEIPLREPWSLSRLYRDGGAMPTRDGALTVVQGRTVGGSTVVNWTSSFRTPEQTLRHWQQHHGIQLMGLNHHLHIVSDQITGRQNVMHTDMPIGNPVTGADEPELDGRSSGLKDPLLDIIRDEVQVIMARDRTVPRVGNADQRSSQIVIAVPHRLKKSPDKGPFGPLQNLFAAPKH